MPFACGETNGLGKNLLVSIWPKFSSTSSNRLRPLLSDNNVCIKVSGWLSLGSVNLQNWTQLLRSTGWQRGRLGIGRGLLGPGSSCYWNWFAS